MSLSTQETLAGIKTANEAWDKGKLRGLEKYHGDKTDSIFKAWSETWLSAWFTHWNIEYLLPSIDSPTAGHSRTQRPVWHNSPGQTLLPLNLRVIHIF